MSGAVQATETLWKKDSGMSSFHAFNTIRMLANIS